MRPSYKPVITVGLLALAVSFCAAATISGTVKGVDGAPFRGAFVEAQNTKTKIDTIVLSNSQGQYSIDNLQPGDYRLRIRAVGYTATPKSGLNLTSDQKEFVDFALQTEPVRWSDISISAGKELFPPGKGKEILMSQCVICHSFQTRMATASKDADQWRAVVDTMRTTMHFHLYRVTDDDADTLAQYLANLFGPDSVLPKSPADIPEYKDTVRTFTSDASNIVYVEYDMPSANRMPFGAAPDNNGFAWIPNFGYANKISRLDVETGMMQDFTVPNVGTAAIHCAAPAPDGSVWLAEQGSNKLGHWDPKTQNITEYQDSYYPGNEGNVDGGQKHTIRIDAQGRIWSSGTPLTMFDPKTEKFTHFEEAKRTYDVKPVPNGDVWFTAQAANKIGYVDGKTQKVTLYDLPTPKSFPRRMEVADDGTVWVGEYDAGKIAHFDPKTGAFKEYVLPGPNSTPYALGIDTAGDIWFDSHEQDIIGRIDHSTGKVTEYPFPHSEISMREFFRDAQGRMWYGTSANNVVGYFYLAGKDAPKPPGS